MCYAYTTCAMGILAHYGSMCSPMYKMSTYMYIPLHSLPYNIIIFILAMYLAYCILIFCNVLMYFPIFTGACYHQFIIFKTVTVLCVNVYIGYCIATVCNDRYGLGHDRLEGCVQVCKSQLSSQALSSPKNNLLIVSSHFMMMAKSLGFPAYSAWSCFKGCFSCWFLHIMCLVVLFIFLF